MAFLANILEVLPTKLEHLSNELLGTLGLDSLKLTKVRGHLDPQPTYQILYGLTVRQVLERMVLSNEVEDISVLEADNEKGENFPLTPMQESYALGAIQGCPCQVYTELDIVNLNIDEFRKAVLFVASKHLMLKAKIIDNIYQKIDNENENYNNSRLQVSDTKNLDERRKECLQRFKENNDLYWDVQLTKLENNTIRVHISIDMIFIDAISTMQLCKEVVLQYNHLLINKSFCKASVPKLEFKDYCRQLILQKSDNNCEQQYNEIPNPPQIPRVKYLEDNVVNFQREAVTIQPKYWDKLKEIAQKAEITYNALILSAFSQVLKFYSENPSFSIAVTMSARPVEKKNDFSGVIGEFTDIILCPIVYNADHKFIDSATDIHNKLQENLEHGRLTGLEQVKLLRKSRGDIHLSFPIVFTSYLGILDSNLFLKDCKITLNYQQTQTPQITLDHQIYETNGKLQVNWDYDANVYDKALIKDMLICFESFLKNVSMGKCENPKLPAETLETRIKINQTKYIFLPDIPHLLHNLVIEAARKFPEAVAIIDQNKRFTYTELISLAYKTATELQKLGIKSGSGVAIILEKGWEQVVGTLAVVMAGAYFVPLNPNDPKERLMKIMELAQCKTAIAKHKSDYQGQIILGENVKTLQIIDDEFPCKLVGDFTPVIVDPEQGAYVIFTSGSSGVPKGVEISHASVVNTCLDINKRFNITENDAIFGISSLSFDLSIWDIFGTLGAGGKLVICKSDSTKDPDYWWEQIKKHKITVWNTVPTTFEMLLMSYSQELLFSIKTVFLSGDAIRISLANKILEKFPDIQLICLGGATEASIWSNFHIFSQDSNELETDLVPYGKALSNQTMYVLGAELDYIPTGVVGEIYIGGRGLAKGYIGDAKLTQEKFINNDALGRLYKTGDIGRYLHNGEIEILGRSDMQVKIGGYRVELGEVERCIEELEQIKKVAVIAVPNNIPYLAGFVTTNKNEEGLIEKIRHHTEQFLPSYMNPKAWMVLDNIPITYNGKVDVKKLYKLALSVENQDRDKKLENSSLESDAILEIVARLMSLPSESLLVSKSLFEQGFSSLHAIQLINILSEKWGYKVPYSLIFNYPSIEQLAYYNTGKKKEQKRLEYAHHKSFNEPIAIVGVSCRVPGDITTTDEFWEMLIFGKNCMTDVPNSRFSMEGIYDSNRDAIGRSYTKRGAFLKNIDKFDYSFFSIPIGEAKGIDPQQRLMLEVAYEAFYKSGYNKEKLKGVCAGIFIGQMNYDWMMCFKYPISYAGTGAAPSITSNRISYTLDLTGPSITIDTACSSSLVAVDAAVMNLRAGTCDVALAGGVNLILSPKPYLMTCQAGMLSIDGRCATFDEAANGIARGEGVGAVVLKRLSDAKAHGDNIIAVIRGSAVNQDGRSAALTVPNGLSQEAVIRQALHNAGLEGKDVDYFECHGTGTTLGDPIEVEAIKNVLGENRVKPLVLGSVKTNIGHLEGAVGIFGLIKAVEVLKRRKAPGNVHFKLLNPKISLDGFNAIISSEPVNLDNNNDSNCLIAAVSSFGYGGTNAHIVLEAGNIEEVDLNINKDVCLFNSVSLPWNEIGNEEEPVSNKFEDIYKLSECLYETSWMPLDLKNSKLKVVTRSSCLVVSRNEITINFPNEWEVVQVLNTHELESALSKSNCEAIFFFSNGGNEDINLGLSLLQLVCGNRKNHNKRIWFVTEFGNVNDAGLWGLARSFRMEHPEISLQCFSYQRDVVSLVVTLEQCLEITEENEFLLDINGNIFVLRLRHSPEIDISTLIPLDLRSDGSYIISGGQGAIGLLMAELLIQCGAKYILLLSRSPIKPETEEKLKDLCKQAMVQLFTCDVSIFEDVLSARKWLENAGWPVVSGVI